MGYGDWIFLGALLLVLGLGALLGFGKVLCMFVMNKIVRTVAAIFFCYTFGGMILSIPFVNKLLLDLASNWSHIAFLTKLHPEIIIYYIALYFITLLVLWLLSKILKGISETDLLPIKIINKVFGALLLTAIAFALMLLVFQIIHWIGGQTAANFQSQLETNCPAIVRPLYESNPLLKIVELIKNK